MKKIVLFIFLATSIISCKKKETVRELDSHEILVKYPVTCYNGQQDPNESGVDCGGPCAPCNIATPTCTPTTNSIVVGTSTYTSTGSACGLSGSQFQMTGSYTNGTYTINLGSSAPDLSIAYTITYGSSSASNEADVTLSDNSKGNLGLTSGSVYFQKVGGKYNAIICSASAYSYVTSQNYAITGKVSCP